MEDKDFEWLHLFQVALFLSNNNKKVKYLDELGAGVGGTVVSMIFILFYFFG